MFSKFIKRPVLAIAISLAIIFLGILAINTRPVSQFPDIAPPRVNIFIAYPGASPEEVESGIILAIEEAIQDLEGIDEIKINDFRACVLHTDMEESGHFECSDELVNQLQHNKYVH